jgi:hypothetical protein
MTYNESNASPTITSPRLPHPEFENPLIVGYRNIDPTVARGMRDTVEVLARLMSKDLQNIAPIQAERIACYTRFVQVNSMHCHGF